jgi:hypothetical protein
MHTLLALVQYMATLQAEKAAKKASQLQDFIQGEGRDKDSVRNQMHKKSSP